ncbi:type II toxin-antitoxin system VapC family toxin [soil metagenome]
MSVVLDASVAISWVCSDESDAFANRVMEKVTEEGGLAPSLWPFEVANIILKKERLKRITLDEGKSFLAQLKRLEIRIESASSSDVLGRTVEVAREYGLTAYDASYLELAIRLRAPLATLDKKLRDAAAAVGLPSL